MGRKPLPTQEKRSAMIFTTLRPKELQQVRAEAEAAGLTVSSVVRRMILRDLQRTPRRERTEP